MKNLTIYLAAINKVTSLKGIYKGESQLNAVAFIMEQYKECTIDFTRIDVYKSAGRVRIHFTTENFFNMSGITEVVEEGNLAGADSTFIENEDYLSARVIF